MFTPDHLRVVERARQQAERLVWRFYALSERERERIHYEVKTLRHLRPEEVTDHALAQVICYDVIRRVGSYIVQRYEVYRICLQDHRLLEVVRDLPPPLDLRALLLYVLTHELVHTVRFVSHLQRVDLPWEERQAEEALVKRTTWRILEGVRAYPMERLRHVLSSRTGDCTTRVTIENLPHGSLAAPEEGTSRPISRSDLIASRLTAPRAREEEGDQSARFRMKAGTSKSEWARLS